MSQDYQLFIRALGLSRSRISKFFVASGLKIGLPIHALDIDETIGPCISDAFLTLESLEMTLSSFNYKSDELNEAKVYKGLRSYLGRTPRLRRLSLDFGLLFGKRPSFDDVFGDPCQVWNQLLELKLQSMKATSECLIKFFTN